MKTNFKWMLVAILTVCGAISVYADDGYTKTRLSNPTLGEGELDGFVAGGAHGNDYTECMAECNGKIYFATASNLGRGYVNVFSPKTDLWEIFNDALWGVYPRSTEKSVAKIYAYDPQNGNFDLVYTAENAVSFHSAVAYKDNVYFGAYTADPTATKPYILKVDTKNNNAYEKVFQTSYGVAMRACCEYDGRLFFAGTDEHVTAVAPEAVKVPKIAVIRKSTTDDTSWTIVANYKAFGDVVKDELFSVWADSPIWSMVEFDGYLYVTLPSSKGFVIFRGHPAVSGETAIEGCNGWYWEEVAGATNGKNNPGLSAVDGGEDGAIGSLCGSLFVFNGKLYAYNFDRSMLGEFSAFFGGFKALTQDTSAKAIDYLNFLYKLVKSQQTVWALNATTGKFEVQENFTQNMIGGLNGRVTEFDGKLFVASMDPGHLYILASQLASDGIFELSPSEIIAKLKSLAETLKILNKSSRKSAQDQQLIDLLTKLQQYLLTFLKCDIVNAANITDILSSTDLASLNELYKQLLSSNVTVSWDYKNLFDLIIKLIQGKLTGNNVDVPDTTLPDLSTLVDYQKLLEDIVKLIQDRLSGGTGTVPEVPGITELLNLILEKLNGTTTTQPDLSDLTALVELLLERLGGNTGSTGNYASLIDLINKLLGNVSNTTTENPDVQAIIDLIKKYLENAGTSQTPDYTALLDLLQSIVSNYTGDTGNILRDLILGALAGNLLDNVKALLQSFNTGALSDYAYIYNRLKAEKMGFDLMYTADGETFEFYTRDGFGDKYNYGCPAFAASKDGKILYVGTSNPFYGGQLWQIEKEATPGFRGADNADAIESIAAETAQTGIYTLDGRRVSGKAQKGIYIYNGKKVAIK